MSFIGAAIGAGVGLTSSLVLPAIQGKPITWQGVLIGTAAGGVGGAAGGALAGAGGEAGGTVGGEVGGESGGITSVGDDAGGAYTDAEANALSMEGANPQATTNALSKGITDTNAIVEKAMNPDNLLQQGMDAVKNAPHLQANVTGGLGGASLGAMLVPPAPGPKYKQTPTQSIYDPIPYTQEDIQRTTVPKYYQYADGGIIPQQPQQIGQVQQPQQPQQPAQPMNKFVQIGLDIAKEIQTENQPKQTAPQAGIPVAPTQMQPPMGAPQQAPMQPQMGIPQQATMQPQQNFAVGGLAQNNVNDPQNNTNASNDNFLRQVRTGVYQQLTAQMASQRAPGAQTAQSISPVQPMAPITPVQSITAPVQKAAGGIMRDNLGGYSHGGIAGLTSAVGSGVSDDIPAQIGTSGKQPARLAANEFVIPARIVSELGQGSSEAGAKILQDMVNRIQVRRSKSVGKGKVAVDSKANKELPA